MDAPSLENLAKNSENKKLYIFNPLDYDFTWNYGGEAFTVPSKENKSFQIDLAKHLGKHLVDAYCEFRGKNYSREQAEKLIFPQ